MHRESSNRRRRSAGALAVLALGLLLTGCAPSHRSVSVGEAHGSASADDAGVGRGAGDGLTIRSADEPIPAFVGGVFADDAEALVASTSMLQSALAELDSIVTSGDPRSGDLSEVATPAFERQLRTELELSASRPYVHATVGSAFIVRRMERGDGERVQFAYCIHYAAQTGDPGDPTAAPWNEEFLGSAVSTAQDPRKLRLELVLPWRGEPFC
jgi:hypothetical protein